MTRRRAAGGVVCFGRRRGLRLSSELRGRRTRVRAAILLLPLRVVITASTLTPIQVSDRSRQPGAVGDGSSERKEVVAYEIAWNFDFAQVREG